MFVTGQNGVIKLKLISSVDKPVKPLQVVSVSFEWRDDGGMRGMPGAGWVCGFLVAPGLLAAAESCGGGMGPSTVGSPHGFPPWVFPAASFTKQARDVSETSVKFG